MPEERPTCPDTGAPVPFAMPPKFERANSDNTELWGLLSAPIPGYRRPLVGKAQVLVRLQAGEVSKPWESGVGIVLQAGVSLFSTEVPAKGTHPLVAAMEPDRVPKTRIWGIDILAKLPEGAVSWGFFPNASALSWSMVTDDLQRFLTVVHQISGPGLLTATVLEAMGMDCNGAHHQPKPVEEQRVASEADMAAWDTDPKLDWQPA